jgi:hypothetical protein
MPTDPTEDGGFQRTLDHYREAFGESAREMWATVVIERPRRSAVPLVGLAARVLALTISAWWRKP